MPGSSALAAAAAGGTCGAHSAPSACSVNVISILYIFVDTYFIEFSFAIIIDCRYKMAVPTYTV